MTGRPGNYAYLNCGEAAAASSLDYILFYLFRGNFLISCSSYVHGQQQSRNRVSQPKQIRETYLTKKMYNLLYILVLQVSMGTCRSTLRFYTANIDRRLIV